MVFRNTTGVSNQVTLFNERNTIVHHCRCFATPSYTIWRTKHQIERKSVSALVNTLSTPKLVFEVVFQLVFRGENFNSVRQSYFVYVNPTSTYCMSVLCLYMSVLRSSYVCLRASNSCLRLSYVCPCEYVCSPSVTRQSCVRPTMFVYVLSTLSYSVFVSPTSVYVILFYPRPA